MQPSTTNILCLGCSECHPAWNVSSESVRIPKKNGATRKAETLFSQLKVSHLVPSRFTMYLKCNTLTINVPVVYMVRYKVVLRGDYP
jgi:hypothetical protein